MSHSYYDNLPENSNLIFHSPLIEAGGTRIHDLSKGHNSGDFLAAGEPAWSQTGTTWTLNFDGSNDRVVLPVAITTGVTTALYACAWFYYTAAAVDKTIIHAVSASSPRALVLRSNAVDITTDAAPGTFKESNWTQPVAGWHFIELLYNGAGLTGYIDFVAGASPGSVTGNLVTLTTFWMGASPNNGGEWWLNGRIGQVRIYNSALSLGQRENIYYSTRALYGV
jgi:hypothetical protein